MWGTAAEDVRREWGVEKVSRLWPTPVINAWTVDFQLRQEVQSEGPWGLHLSREQPSCSGGLGGSCGVVLLVSYRTRANKAFTPT